LLGQRILSLNTNKEPIVCLTLFSGLGAKSQNKPEKLPFLPMVEEGDRILILIDAAPEPCNVALPIDTSVSGVRR
jgi:hypothetical protein